MNSAHRLLVDALNDCGCFDGLQPSTPIRLDNRPGLDAVSYRIGTHWRFKQSMLARLSAGEHRVLHALTSRDDDDFTIALLDAWATVADVLTFYQERIANECFLRTARERLSLLQLARLIGYQLRPGVAASTDLVFTVEDALGSPEQAFVEVGAKVQSIPGPDEQPQVFETIEKLAAHVRRNSIRPRLTQTQVIGGSAQTVFLAGTSTAINPGDTMLIVTKSDERIVKRVRHVSIDVENAITRIQLENVQAAPLVEYQIVVGLVEAKVAPNKSIQFVEDSKEIQVGPIVKAVQSAETSADNTLPAELFAEPVELSIDFVNEYVMDKTLKTEDLVDLAKTWGWKQDELEGLVKSANKAKATAVQPRVYVFRQQATLFGYNAPKDVSFSNGESSSVEWIPSASEAPNRLFLDIAYEQIISGSYIAVHQQSPSPQLRVFRVGDVAVVPRTDYGISGKSTRLTLANGAIWWSLEPVFSGKEFEDEGQLLRKIFQVIRTTLVHAQSEELELAGKPITDPVQGNSIELGGSYDDLRVGQVVYLTGNPVDNPTIVRSERMTIASLDDASGYTVVEFTQSLARSYERNSVAINANVARATHGETVTEVLGDGDSSRTYQQFPLLNSPLTHVSANTPSGARSTLQIRVNDLAWHEGPSLLGHGPDDRVFVTRLDDDGNTTVQFGDGRTGRRLSSGTENVHASFRRGIGLPGMVKAGQLSMLITRPLGLREVTNLADATGAQDAESFREVQTNAPLTMLTLDRAVSLQDYEDFAHAFLGIGKALATWTWEGHGKSVFITVAGPNGLQLDKAGTITNLRTSLKQFGDPFVRVTIEPYRPATFRINARVGIHPDYESDNVIGDTKALLQERFSFETRQFGQPVARSEVIAAIQGVPGVRAVDLNRIYVVGQLSKADPLPPYLRAEMPRAGSSGAILGAQLLTLGSVSLEVLA